MEEALLDTDILSEVLKAKDAILLAKAREYLSLRQRFAFSAMTQSNDANEELAGGSRHRLSSLKKSWETSFRQ